MRAVAAGALCWYLDTHDELRREALERELASAAVVKASKRSVVLGCRAGDDHVCKR